MKTKRTVVKRTVRMSIGKKKPRRIRAASLVSEVGRFCEASRRGDYYESFRVNSSNFMDTSEGTESWLEECERLFERCVSEAKKHGPVETRKALGSLLDLLRHVDEGHDDVVFFADEGGSWQVDVDWKKVLPVWFRCLAATCEPDEYAREALSAIRDFAPGDRAHHLKVARAAATPEQEKALAGQARA